MPLLLQRVGLGIGSAEQLYPCGLQFHTLLLAWRFYHSTIYPNAGPRGDLPQQLLAEVGYIYPYLEVGDGRAIIERDEGHRLIAAFRAYPTHYS